MDGRYKGLLDDIGRLESFDAIANIITPSLYDYQAKDLLHILAVKRFCCMYDTGMGKTMVASAFIKALKNEDSSRKCLMFVTNNQLFETAKKIEECSGLKTVCYDGTDRVTFTSTTLQGVDVVLLTHSCLISEVHMLNLVFNLDKFHSVIADELHLVSNFTKSKNAFMLQSIFERFEYVLALTATPITTDQEQLARALYMVNPAFVDDWKAITLDLKKFGSSVVDTKLRDLFIVRQRSMNHHRGLAINIPAMEHQKNAKGQNLFEITKGVGATLQHEAVKQIVEYQRPKTGLIYSNRHSVQYALYDSLLEKGIRVGLINGKILGKAREEIISGFRNGQYDVLITNITTAIDLDCDYIVFYEFTPHVKQFIGRGERGIISKPMDILFLFTDDTDEYDYFIRNVYLISQSVQEILNIDMKEVTKLQKSNVFD